MYWIAAAAIAVALVGVWVGIVESVATILFPAAWLASMVHIAGIGFITWQQPERASATMARSLLMAMATLLISLTLMRDSPSLADYFAIALTVSLLGFCALWILLHIAAKRSR